MSPIINFHFIAELIMSSPERLNASSQDELLDDPKADMDPNYLSFIRSQRGAPLLTRLGYVYRCERHTGSRSYWLCIRYKNFKCGGRIICDGNTVVKEKAHNHHQDWQRIGKSQIEYKSLTDHHDMELFLNSFRTC